MLMKPGPLTSALATAGAAVSRAATGAATSRGARPSRLDSDIADVGLEVGEARRPDQRIGAAYSAPSSLRQRLLHERAERWLPDLSSH